VRYLAEIRFWLETVVAKASDMLTATMRYLWGRMSRSSEVRKGEVLGREMPGRRELEV